MSIEIKRSDKYVDYNISAANNRGYITIDTSDWINKPWMFYELPSLKFEIYTETNGELVKYQNFTREIRTYNPVYSPLGVLNVTIDIRNVPEEFILRITPIFDNDSISARNMLIENGIEDGEIWGSDQDVPTQLFNLNLEFIECEGEYVPPTPPVPPTHEETITGVPPITFDGSTGEPLVSWTILGNSYQASSPTPDNPVMPEFVGVKTANVMPAGEKKTVVSNGVTFDSDGNGRYHVYGTATGEATAKFNLARGFITPISVSNNGQGTLSFFNNQRLSNVTVAFYNGTSKVDDWVMSPLQRTSTAYNTIGNKYVDNIILRVPSGTQVDMLITPEFTNDGVLPTEFEPFGYKIPISCGGETTPVYLGQVSTVRIIRKLVLTGEENITSGHLDRNLFNIPIDDYLRAPIVGVICTHYIAQQNVDEWSKVSNGNACFYIGTNSEFKQLYIRDSSYSTIADFKSYLAQQYTNGTPVTIWYVLAEPETAIVNEPLAKIGDYADELHSTDAGVSIPTVKGSNTLTVETELQPSEMTITYIKDGQ